MPRFLLYLTVGVLVYASALVATAPATLIGPTAERLTGGVLVVRGATGTLWRGSAVLFARDPGGALVRIAPLSWTAAPGWSGLEVHAAGTDPSRPAHLEAIAGWRHLSVRSLDAEVPAAIVRAAWPAVATWRPEGRLRVRSRGLQVDREAVLGAAEVEWRGARLQQTGPLDLGAHVARLSGNGKTIRIELATLQGPPRVQGAGAWVPRGSFELSGTIEQPGQTGDKLATFLQGVCPEFRDGRCSFKISTTGL